MNLQRAIHAHADWTMKLCSAMSGEALLAPTANAKYSCCALGQWLHGEAKAKFSQFGAYHECLTAHAAFHREAGKVARLIAQKKFLEAEAALESNSSYSLASGQIGAAILRLEKETVAHCLTDGADLIVCHAQP